MVISGVFSGTNNQFSNSLDTNWVSSNSIKFYHLPGVSIRSEGLSPTYLPSLQMLITSSWPPVFQTDWLYLKGSRNLFLGYDYLTRITHVTQESTSEGNLLNCVQINDGLK